MKNKKLKLKLVIIFAIIILMSFVPEFFPDFFGDWKCVKEKCSYTGIAHGITTHWGFRHWMWTLCGVILFIWNLSEIFEDEE